MNDQSRNAGNRIWLMSSVSRYQYLASRLLWLAVASMVVAAFLLIRTYHLIHSIPEQEKKPIELDCRHAANVGESCDWSVFQSRDGSVSTMGGTASSRFRLAGTFFEYVSGVTGAGDVRRAVIDDLKNASQLIVREGEKIDDTSIVKIFRDHVIIRLASGSEDQLWLTFSVLSSSSKAAGATNEVASAGQVANVDKFGGRQIGENKWVFSREKLLEYYKELRDDPDRLVKIFDSLKPVYVEGANRINGYRLGIEGEADFFKSVGLSDGDIVRSVNTMQMSNRNRAEYFISEFVADRANAFIMEIERGGKSERLDYRVR